MTEQKRPVVGMPIRNKISLAELGVRAIDDAAPRETPASLDATDRLEAREETEHAFAVPRLSQRDV